MSERMSEQNKVSSDNDRGTRLRISFGGLLIPISIVIAIGALETARIEEAHREVFFNIQGFAIMYFIFGIAVAAIAIITPTIIFPIFILVCHFLFT